MARRSFAHTRVTWHTSTTDMAYTCGRTRGIRVLWLALAPAAITVVPSAAVREVVEGFVPAWWVAASGVSLLFLLGSVLHREGRRVWRAVVTLALMAFMAAMLLSRPEDAERGLVLLSGMVGFLAYVWPPDRLRVLDHLRVEHPAEFEVQVAALVATLFGFDAWLSMPAATVASVSALTVLFLVPVAYAWRGRLPRCGSSDSQPSAFSPVMSGGRTIFLRRAWGKYRQGRADFQALAVLNRSVFVIFLRAFPVT